MGRITRLDGEHGVEVSGLFLPERVLPDRLNERSINPLLQLRTVITDDSLRCRLRRLFGLLLRRFLRLVTHKLTLRLHTFFLLRALEDVGGDAAHVHIFDVHPRRRRNDVARVDATDRHAVVFHGPGDDQRTVAGQLLQDHHTAATEAASKDDGDGAGLAALAQRRVLGALAAHFLGNLPGGTFLLSEGHRPFPFFFLCVCVWVNFSFLTSLSLYDQSLSQRRRRRVRADSTGEREGGKQQQHTNKHMEGALN
ncbi:hypothetical protein TCDM_03101 [Trypanosoma cruzi Dm28c]|uniref:Uncharacterized protein n=1 Tax=Trypanosoma cruzi Dm28c TaxID=1416333 RepID=V5BK47_TRYCR|nr:hypothetical protein TCDM_03101 [Trypanosoma cruzi Dm28c]